MQVDYILRLFEKAHNLDSLWFRFAIACLFAPTGLFPVAGTARKRIHHRNDAAFYDEDEAVAVYCFSHGMRVC